MSKVLKVLWKNLWRYIIWKIYWKGQIVLKILSFLYWLNYTLIGVMVFRPSVWKWFKFFSGPCSVWVPGVCARWHVGLVGLVYLVFARCISVFHSFIVILWGLGTLLLFPDFLSLKLFGNSWSNSYIPCLLVIIAHRFTCGERKVW